MSVEVTGLNKLLKEIEDRYGKDNVQRVSDRALEKGAEVFVRELKSQFESFKDTGASLREITVSKPMTIGKERAIKVHWKGPDNRYRIIHLNEFGTVKNPNPKGKGAIARAMRNAENAYHAAIVEAVRRGL
ncbi:phage protein, HK97 gp10 family [Terribacillus aidingensis]|uniref:Phage protein, HK97 gp10 family n=1 Tax=Terribacillus aidingensis TaxID=586416 RepID=A0A285P324_9BACI|nr:HK97-gp10 family putative phage morphogenesis protein [Terribacillus aidingensis]SNZ14556.1 phage protein, HK97 gp10 family [Terribacillus aidingensis]